MSEPDEIPWEKAAHIAQHAPGGMMLMSPVRALKYADKPRYWILSDSMYRAKRVEEGRWVPPETP